MFRFFRPISSWFLLTSGWIEPLLVGGYAPFSPVVEYRSVRFGISYYTIWDIVLYDLKYRTIRFGISYYTIWDIVLYDFEYRTIRFWISYYTIPWKVVRCGQNPGDGVGRGLLQPATHPSRCPRPCRWMFVAATSVTPADGASDWPWCGFRLFITIWLIVLYIAFTRLLPCFKGCISMLEVWHLEWGVTLVYINYMEKNFFYFEKIKITP